MFLLNFVVCSTYISTRLHGVTSQKTVFLSSILLHGTQLSLGRALYGPVLLTLGQKRKVTTGLRTSRCYHKTICLWTKTEVSCESGRAILFVTSGRSGSDLDPILTQAFIFVSYLH
jgi:hypothetical protein